MSVLYVSDLDGTLLDGTLLDGTHRLSATTVRIINDLVAEGLLFTVATARSPVPTMLVLGGLDLRTPIVCMNGAVIVAPVTGEVVRRSTLDPSTTRRLVDERLAAGLHPIVYSMDATGEHHAYYQGIFNECERFYVEDRLSIGDRRFRLVPDFGAAYHEEIFGISVIAPYPDLVPLHDRVAADPDLYGHLSADLHLPEFFWLETHHAGANKGAAVRWVADHLGVERVVCFGDNVNDLPMFRVADEAYAVADAAPELRAAATGLIGAHTDDAVARFLRDVTAVIARKE